MPDLSLFSSLKTLTFHPTYTQMQRCPTCRSNVKPREQNPAFPFCSPRCRAIDLGKWFTGSYRVPDKPAPQSPPREEDDQ